MTRLKPFLFLVLILPLPLFAQRLLEGEYQSHRERSIDIIHYRAELILSPAERYLSGKAEILFQPLRNIEEISVDAFRLDVKSVKLILPKPAPLIFKSSDRDVSIRLDRSYTPKDRLTISIEYSCRPNAGMYFQRDPAKSKLIFVHTYGEGGLHANWLPIYNDVNDKFSTEMIVTAPSPYTVISNGKLLKTSGASGGGKSFHWKQEKPHPNYLISIYAGEFEKGDLPPAFGSIPLSYWVPKGRLNEGKYAFRNTTKMVEFFSNRFDYRYPWEKYDQIAIPDYSIGAMEHTSVTGHQAGVLRVESAPYDFGPPRFDQYYNFWTAESTIAHELAHHWFGNNLTCRSLSELWMNESFASYLQMLWDEESLGKMDLQMDRQFALDLYIHYVKTQHWIRPLEYHYFDKPDEIYNEEHSYFKGAIVLHMLRSILGDADFFRALGYYVKKHEFGNVTGRDLKVAIEESVGRNLEWFFDDWIYGGGHPVLEVEYRYLEGPRMIDLIIKQIQPVIKGQDEFTLPVEVSIATKRGIQKETVWIRKHEEQFFLPAAEKPLMISIDGQGALVAEIRFEKDLDELLYQLKKDELPGRIWALRQLVESYPLHQQTLPAITQLLSPNEFWGIQAEAALQLGAIQSEEAEKALDQALKCDDYRVRKAAVLALPQFRSASAEKTLTSLIENDPHSDVVATAIVALSRINNNVDGAIIRRNINRPSWNSEITIGSLEALENLQRKELVADIRPFVDEKNNQHVRLAALRAWKSCNPEDPNLHRTLMSLTKDSTYDIQKLAIEMLGDLYVSDARKTLQQIAAESGDPNVRIRANESLEKIDELVKKLKGEN